MSRKIAWIFDVGEREKSKAMRRKIATLPRTVEAKSGDWYVYFSVLNPITGKMAPQKVYRGFKDCNSSAEKKRWGVKLCAEITEKLKLGWTPFDQDTVIYSDQIEYQNLAGKFSKLKKSIKNTRYYLSDFLIYKRPLVKDKTYSTYQSKLRIFCTWLDHSGYRDYDVSSISNKIILEFFRFLIVEQKLDRVTIIKYMQMIRDYFSYMKKMNKVSENPVTDIPIPPKTKDNAPRPINPIDLDVLLTKIKAEDPQLFLACMFQYYLAVRPGNELRSLKVRDIDLFNNTVVITDESAKAGRRTIDLPDPLVDICRELQIEKYNLDFYVFGKSKVPGPERVGNNTLRNRFNIYRTLLKLPQTYKFYSMKHTGGGMLLAAGRTIEELRNHMGHKSIESTDHYVRRHFGNRNEAIIKNFPSPFLND